VVATFLKENSTYGEKVTTPRRLTHRR
jgi:hypothetical protein